MPHTSVPDAWTPPTEPQKPCSSVVTDGAHCWGIEKGVFARSFRRLEGDHEVTIESLAAEFGDGTARPPSATREDWLRMRHAVLDTTLEQLRAFADESAIRVYSHPQLLKQAAQEGVRLDIVDRFPKAHD